MVPPPLLFVQRRIPSKWIEALTSQFYNLYTNEDDIRVFSKHNDKNRKAFRLNELLHDVCVCKAGKVQSVVQGKELEYIKKPLWQVESEFARDSRAVLIDFNKLVLGSARNKLLVTSRWI